jgi:hypothetical protein
METMKEFRFAFEDLQVSVADVASLMGYGADLPETFQKMISAGLSETPDIVSIRGGYRFSERFNPGKETASFEFEGISFYPGKIVLSQLEKATSAALFICTSGDGISARSKSLMSSGEMMEGYIFDVIGSVIVEKAMDKIQGFLKNEVEGFGLGISNRFSPGYCNWDVAEQQKLFPFFPAGFCGVTLTESSLMKPVKSVSGIIGIGPGLVEKGYRCQRCNDKNCIYRKIRQRVSA